MQALFTCLLCLTLFFAGSTHGDSTPQAESPTEESQTSETTDGTTYSYAYASSTSGSSSESSATADSETQTATTTDSTGAAATVTVTSSTASKSSTEGSYATDGSYVVTYTKKAYTTTEPQEPEGTPFRQCAQSTFGYANPKTCANPFHVQSVNTTEELLRTFMLCGDIANGAAFFAQSEEWFGLIAGLRYRPDPKLCNYDRNCDPDVVAYRILTKAALDTEDFFKSAFIAVSSRDICECPAGYGRRLMQGNGRRSSRRRSGQVRVVRREMQTSGSNNMRIDANNNPGKRKLLTTYTKSYTSLVSAFCERCWPARTCFVFDHCPVPDNLDPETRKLAIEYDLI